MRLSLVWSAVLASVLSGAACADDLMDVYGVALVKDPVVLQIKAQRDAVREAINEVDAAMLPQINLSGDIALLKAKAVLCPGLTITFFNEITNEKYCWCFKGDLKEYLVTALGECAYVPSPEPFAGHMQLEDSIVDWAFVWMSESSGTVAESYVNLIPTPLGGTHVNGLRQAVNSALKEFCDIHNMLPKNVTLTIDDTWDNISFVLSVKIPEPQFAGQTKEKLSNRECASLVVNAVKDSFTLWLNANIEAANAIAERC